VTGNNFYRIKTNVFFRTVVLIFVILFFFHLCCLSDGQKRRCTRAYAQTWCVCIYIHTYVCMYVYGGKEGQIAILAILLLMATLTDDVKQLGYVSSYALYRIDRIQDKYCTSKWINVVSDVVRIIVASGNIATVPPLLRTSITVMVNESNRLTKVENYIYIFCRRWV